MTNDSSKTVQEPFKLHVMDGIHPSKLSILKNYSMLHFKIESMHCKHETHQRHMELQCTLSHRAFLLFQQTTSEPENYLHKRSTLVSFLLHRDTLGHILSWSLCEKCPNTE